MAIDYYGLGNSNNSIPIGSVVHFPFAIGAPAGTGNVWTNYPSGFLPCDGRSLYKEDYPELADLVGDSAGLPLNTDGGIITSGSQGTSGFSLTWNTQSPKNVRLYNDKLIALAGVSALYTNDKGTSWNNTRTVIGAPSVFRSIGSAGVSGNYAYVGGAEYLNNSGAQTGMYVYKFPLDGSPFGGFVSGTIGAGGIQSTTVLGCKGTTIYVYVTAGVDAGKIFKSTNAGDSWTYTRDMSSIADSVDVNTFWYVASRGVFVFDGTVSAVTGTYEIADFEAATSPVLATSNRTNNGVTFDGVNYWFTSGGQLYRTANFVSIVAVGTPIPTSFNGYVSIADGKIFVGGNTGYYSSDIGVTWNVYIADGGDTELPFGADTGRSLFGLINRGDDNTTDLYKLKLASSSGLTFDLPSLSVVDGLTRCIKVSS
jgi:hypothetical protein